MIRSVLIVVILGLLAACSGVKLGYNSAEKVLAYRMDDWFGLSEAMREPARERLHRVLAWHRREELPRYVHILRAAERRLEDPAPLSVSELLTLQQQVTGRLLELGSRTADEFADVLTQFGPPQRRRLLARLAESNEEFREDYLHAGEAAVRKRRIDQLVDRYELWLGRLAPAQRAHIEQWVGAHPSDAPWRLGLREARQQAFVGIVDDAMQRQSPPRTSARLRAFFADLETPVAADVRARHEEGARARAQLTADLFNMATPAQRERARERLRKLSDDFLALSGQGAGR
ncbi:hypothetical protein CDO44_24720 [Pigmentiphaga sp. NML080357]|uniref:DUF6279 family lipoprotein n=1 Tax=Pigmentiphaga sp. NML080357 TaxID=2008675 RepID=UPI000B413FF1|nr:DUF6279 family lipoprotein [Pigmentiphaga sp. NML080357]OVZ55417.1 hypothetical protein CDO44_24720 [Pigmentiphaga sp. NML080357]